MNSFPHHSLLYTSGLSCTPLDCTMLGSELPLSNLTRFCTFWLTLGHDANLNICISHQLWPKCLTLLLFSLQYSCTLPLASTGLTAQVPGKQLATLPGFTPAFPTGMSHQTHTGLWPVMLEAVGANDGWHRLDLRNTVHFGTSAERGYINRSQCSFSSGIMRNQHSLLV